MLFILVSLYVLFSALLLPYGYNCFYMVYGSYKYRSEKPIKLENHPVVTVQLPMYNERYVAHRCIRAACSLEWPRDRLQILVLDDSTDETSRIIDSEVEGFASSGLDIDVIRRETRDGFKAGALQNALKSTKGKYVALFDADFLPQPSFLHETVPLMERDPSIGFVQARWGHLNRDYNKLTETFAIGLDGHHIVEQAGRSALGLPLNFNGTCGVLRAEAIRDAGGWASDTLSEDMDLSYRMQLGGWRAAYLREVVVPGELPPTLFDFRSQQARWAMGSIQCERKLLGDIWRSDIFTTRQKVESTIHLTYYAVCLMMLAILILAVPVVAVDALSLVQFYLPYGVLLGLCVVSSTTMYYEAIRYSGASFREKLPYLGLIVLVGYGISVRCSASVLRGLFSRGGSFSGTPKYNLRNKSDDLRPQDPRSVRGSVLPEQFFALYALTGMVIAALRGHWLMSFYLLIYLAGYSLMAYYGLHANVKP
jgi:cellulose synthase/poly-beta-1,6-N-acetylglucosamine synthase-like glycosyltransferase